MLLQHIAGIFKHVPFSFSDLKIPQREKIGIIKIIQIYIFENER